MTNEGYYEQVFGEEAGLLRTGMPAAMTKIEARRALLAEKPELRLRVQLPLLRNIVDFADFKCAKGSSVARDEAIRGSDIDGGIVVLHEAIETEVELSFVNALREQGFTVYHPVETEAATAAYNDAILRAAGQTEIDTLLHASVQAEVSRIRFYTADELHAANPRINPGLTYRHGFSIPDYSGD